MLHITVCATPMALGNCIDKWVLMVAHGYSAWKWLQVRANELIWDSALICSPVQVHETSGSRKEQHIYRVRI